MPTRRGARWPKATSTRWTPGTMDRGERPADRGMVRADLCPVSSSGCPEMRQAGISPGPSIPRAGAGRLPTRRRPRRLGRRLHDPVPALRGPLRTHRVLGHGVGRIEEELEDPGFLAEADLLHL